MNSKWLRMILADKDKVVKVGIITNGKYQIYNIVAIEDETPTEIILATQQQKNHET